MKTIKITSKPFVVAGNGKADRDLALAGYVHGFRDGIPLMYCKPSELKSFQKEISEVLGQKVRFE